MEMTVNEIVKSYNQRIGSAATQIGILADLNGTTKEEIEKVLIEAGEEVPKRGRKPKIKQEKPQEEEEEPQKETKLIPEALLQMAYKKLEDLDNEIQYHKKKIEEATKNYKEIIDFIGYTPERAEE